MSLDVKPGDTNVAGSGSDGERADVFLPSQLTAATPGTTQWWAWSTLFPPEYRPTPDTAWNVFLDFHNTGSGGQANLQFQVETHPKPPLLELSVWGGDPAAPEHHLYVLGPLVRNGWFDFVLRVTWSPSHTSGSIELYVNGKRTVFAPHLATLYTDEETYLKVANYRQAGPFESTILTSDVRRAMGYGDAIHAFPNRRRWPLGQANRKLGNATAQADHRRRDRRSPA